MTGRPREGEAAPYYFTYIDRAVVGDGLAAIERQFESLAFLPDISQEASRHRYAPGKWSIREICASYCTFSQADVPVGHID